LKQAPRAWNKRIDQFLLQIGFKKCKAEYGIYVQKFNEENMTVIYLYVDDLLVTGSNQIEIEKFKHTMQCEFEMTDLVRLSYFLGLKFKTSKVGIMVHQQKYIGELLERFQMIDCNIASNPFETNVKLDECSNEERVEPTQFKQIVGSLRYLCNIRPNICFAVSIIGRFMNDPRKSHLTAA